MSLTARTQPAEPPVLYAGVVTHARHEPIRNRFKYRLWMLGVDLDDMDSLTKQSRLFRHNRPGLISFHDRDHGARGDIPLRAWVEQALAVHGLQPFGTRIRLIAMPRVFGYAFNPISFYFCYDSDNRLGAILHQVKNTFGDQIGYLMSVQMGETIIRQSIAKQMHVSPFFDMQGRYDFTISLTPRGFTTAISYGTDTERLAVGMALTGQAFTSRALIKLLITMPLAPLKIILAIHWQALRLFLRGVAFHRMPEPRHHEVVKGSVP